MFFLNIEPSFATVAAVALTFYLILYRLQTVKSHPDEPPIIPSAVPYVGHLLGMALKGGRYIKQIGIHNRDKPIFTLPVPGSRIYVVTDPALAAAVQRASKALSFTPLVPDITKRILGLDRATVAIVRQNIDPEPGDPRGFLADVHDSVYSSLGPGSELNTLSLSATTELASQLNEFANRARSNAHHTALASQPNQKSPSPAVPVDDLLVWVRHFVASGTARFLYGEKNPISARPELEDAFWDFDHGLGGLLMGVAPSVTARKAYQGREALTAAFTDYLQKGYHKEEFGTADIVRRRVEVAERYGWTNEAIARSDVSFLFAGIVNTATTTFWTVLYLFAHPDLLCAVREELAVNVVLSPAGPQGDSEKEEEATSQRRAIIALDALKTSCPTLLAVMRECLRLGSDNYSTRLVKTDTMLAGRHYIKANSVVQIAGGVIHADQAIWGGDAADFNPNRFLKHQARESNSSSNGSGDKANNSSNRSTAPSNILEKQTNQAAGESATSVPPQSSNTTTQGIHPAAFRAFGGGKTLCPGRHFATNEILAFVAMIVLMFDIDSPDGGKQGLRIPEKDDGVMPVHILEPKVPVKVLIRLRDDVREVRVV